MEQTIEVEFESALILADDSRLIEVKCLSSEGQKYFLVDLFRFCKTYDWLAFYTKEYEIFFKRGDGRMMDMSVRDWRSGQTVTS